MPSLHPRKEAVQHRAIWLRFSPRARSGRCARTSSTPTRRCRDARSRRCAASPRRSDPTSQCRYPNFAEAVHHTPVVERADDMELTRPVHGVVDLRYLLQLGECLQQPRRPRVAATQVPAVVHHDRRFVLRRIGGSGGSCSSSVCCNGRQRGASGGLPQPPTAACWPVSCRRSNSPAPAVARAYSMASMPPQDCPSTCTRSSPRSRRRTSISSTYRLTVHKSGCWRPGRLEFPQPSWS